MGEFGEYSPHGWEKSPGSHDLGRIWELGIQKDGSVLKAQKRA